jgi:protein tyrosine/serine phosphatase
MTSSKLKLADADSSPPVPSTYWIIKDLFLAGPFPGGQQSGETASKLKVLLEAGVATFINLMEEDETNYAGERFESYESTASALATLDVIRCQRFPIRDRSIPNRETMLSILDGIDESLSRQQPVYVHCWGGVGRTGTVVGCWLIRHGLATRENFLQTIRTLRQHDKVRGERKSPENTEQESFVRSWNRDG